MKAHFVFCSEDPDRSGVLVAAESRNAAKVVAVGIFGADYIDVAANRATWADHYCADSEKAGEIWGARDTEWVAHGYWTCCDDCGAEIYPDPGDYPDYEYQWCECFTRRWKEAQ